MRPIGDNLDALGVEAELADTDLIASALCICSVLEEGQRQPRILITASDGLSVIEQAGLVSLAQRIITDGFEDGKPETDILMAIRMEVSLG